MIEQLARPPLVEARTETIEASDDGAPRRPAREGALMVELKGVEPPFPLYGDFKLADGKRVRSRAARRRRRGRRAAAARTSESCASATEIKIGESTFRDSRRHRARAGQRQAAFVSARASSSRARLSKRRGLDGLRQPRAPQHSL